MRVSVVICLALAGCRSLLGIEDPTLGDGGTSNDGPGPDARSCYGVAPSFQICLASPPTVDRPIPLVIDTDSGADCSETTATGICVFAGVDVLIKNGVTATGSRPLAILATNSLMVMADIDVGGHGASSGPGVSASVACQNGTVPVQGNNGGGGGAGGSFVTIGGSGGFGNGQGSKGGSPGGLESAGSLRAGCLGMRGAAGGGALPDPGGGGGGAVYLLAGATMSVEAKINASGGGGAGGRASKSGGSGGGSGGMIVLWSPVITGNVVLFANGGGGGGGADNGAGGQPGHEATGIAAALGGLGGSGGTGQGGNGSSGLGNGMPGTDDMTGAGGGAGGGGGGAIRLFGNHDALTVMASPPAS